MTPTRSLLCAAGALVLSALAPAQTLLVQYDPLGPQGTGQPVFPTTVAPIVTASDLIQVGFVGGWGNTDVWPVGQLGVASAALDPTQYVEFTVTPLASLQLTRLSYSRRSYVNEGNRAAAVRTSLDGFMADVDTLTGLAPTGDLPLDFDLSSLPPISGPVDLRVYFYDAPSTGLDWVDLVSTASGGNGLVLEGISGGIGTPYCTPAALNSAGLAGEIAATGSTSAAANLVTLEASNLPPSQFGIFIVGDTRSFVPGAGGSSNGNLCVGGGIGRYSNPGEIRATGAAGAFSLDLHLTALRRPSSNVVVAPGDTWRFQAWHRDGVGLGSNFTSAVEITFQ